MRPETEQIANIEVAESAVNLNIYIGLSLFLYSII